MSTITPETSTDHGFTTIALGTAYGQVFRRVSKAPPRDCNDDEIPVIDISGIYGDLEMRMKLAEKVRAAAINTGFFYIKNHGIEKKAIEKCKAQALKFFHQSPELKNQAGREKSNWFNGYTAAKTKQMSPTESANNREGFMWCYDPRYDPSPKNPSAIPTTVAAHIHGEDFIWDGTSHLPDFKKNLITYWQACLTLSRRLVQTFALALDLEETYFDDVTTYPGSDCGFNFYPAMKAEELKSGDVPNLGIGSHTDIQSFTLLWQHMVGGLQILNKDDEWIKAPPIKDTFVVNIGDFLQRLSNDKFKSTVHKVYNRSEVDRISMPFLFGFNLKIGVMGSCVDEEHPVKYEPVSCAEWVEMRFRR